MSPVPSRDLFGFGPDAPEDERVRAQHVLETEAKVICMHCGTWLIAHKATVHSHLTSEMCADVREKHVAATAAAALQSLPAPPRVWDGNRNLLMLSKPQPRRGRDDAEAHQAHQAKLVCLVAANASAHDMSLTTTAEFFGVRSSMRLALAQLGPDTGVGSVKSVKQHVERGITLVQEEDVSPMLRRMVTLDLFGAFIADESPTPCLGGAPVLLVHFFCAGMKEPVCVDLAALGRAANHVSLRDTVKGIMTAPGRLSEEEYAKHIKILSGDNASYMVKAAATGNFDRAADPPHVFDLVIKVVINASGLRPLLMALRKVLHGKTYVVPRLLAALSLPPDLAKVPTTRWGYWAMACRILSDLGTVARVQHALMWLYESYGGNLDELDGSAWLAGVPFGPDSHASSAEGEAPLADAGLPVEDQDWEEATYIGGAAKASAATPVSDLDESDTDDDDDPKTGKHARRRLIQKVFAALASPKIIALMRVVVTLIDPMRKAQSMLQTVNGLDPDCVGAFVSAYSVLEACVASEASFRAAIMKAKEAIVSGTREENDSVSYAVTITRDDAGNISAQGVGDLKRPLWCDVISSTGGSAEAAWEDVVTRARDPVMRAVKQYIKFGIEAYNVAQRRHYAALHVNLADMPFVPTLAAKMALPPDMRARGPGTHEAATVASATDGAFDFDRLEDLSAESPHVTKLRAEWAGLLSVYTVGGSACFVAAGDKASPADYWLRARAHYPLVAKVMLWWLSHPVGSASVERDFSGMTIVSRSFRRRRLKLAAFRSAVLSHCYKLALRQKLDAAVAVREQVRR